jgi:hypothetical protein
LLSQTVRWTFVSNRWKWIFVVKFSWRLICFKFESEGIVSEILMKSEFLWNYYWANRNKPPTKPAPKKSSFKINLNCQYFFLWSEMDGKWWLETFLSFPATIHVKENNFLNSWSKDDNLNLITNCSSQHFWAISKVLKLHFSCLRKLWNVISSSSLLSDKMWLSLIEFFFKNFLFCHLRERKMRQNYFPRSQPTAIMWINCIINSSIFMKFQIYLPCTKIFFRITC